MSSIHNTQSLDSSLRLFALNVKYSNKISLRPKTISYFSVTLRKVLTVGNEK